jgi:hypothetical protein
MDLWTDLIDPVELSGFAREEAEAWELQWGTLARYLPNRFVPDIHVEVKQTDNGLVPEARYRAFDAEPEIGSEEGGSSLMLKLPAISQKIPVSEYRQLRARNASDEVIRDHIKRTTRRVARAIADRAERARGIVINTGKATADQKNFGFDDDFGRSTDASFTASALWSVTATDRLQQLHDWVELYEQLNKRAVGSILMTRAPFGALARGDQFRVQLNNGASRPLPADEIRQTILSDDLPPIDLYNRQTASGAVLPADAIFLMPAPVDPNDEDGSPYGATTWGQTLAASEPEWGIEPTEQPGIVVAAFKAKTIPQIAEVQGDSISLPTAANPDYAMRIKVL